MRQGGILSYTAQRLLVLAATVVVFYFLGLRDLWLIFMALVTSGVISLLLLNRARDGASMQTASLITRLNTRLGSGAAKEDAIVEQALAEGLASERQPQDPDRQGSGENQFSETRET